MWRRNTMARLVWCVAIALCFFQGSESSIADSLKKEMEVMKSDLISRVILGSADLSLAIKEAKKGKSSWQMDWEACVALTDGLIAGEDMVSEAAVLGMEIVHNFTEGSKGLIQCATENPWDMFRCFIDQAEKMKDMAASIGDRVESFESRAKELGATIRQQFWKCIGRTTAAPTTRAPTSQPTPAPTTAPTAAPTPEPTKAPTNPPTPAPTPAPSTEAPKPQSTKAPTPKPTDPPAPKPTDPPAPKPTDPPTPKPTNPPAPKPTDPPVPKPTDPPAPKPTEAPTPKPTEAQPVAPTPKENFAVRFWEKMKRLFSRK